MTRVLLIEDNADLQFALVQALDGEGFSVETVSDGPRGLAAALAGTADLIVLDVMLPGIDGFHVLRQVRNAGIETPILMLTARGEEEDKLRGFRLGADDYLTKPFGVRELLARVDALLRRQRAARGAGATEQRPRTDVVSFGDVEVSPAGRVVRRGGETVALRPREMDLLLALIGRPGEVMSRGALLKQVWSYNETVTTRTVDIHVAELRRKLESEPAAPKHFVTVWKAGYRFDP